MIKKGDLVKFSQKALNVIGSRGYFEFHHPKYAKIASDAIGLVIRDDVPPEWKGMNPDYEVFFNGVTVYVLRHSLEKVTDETG